MNRRITQALLVASLLLSPVVSASAVELRFDTAPQIISGATGSVARYTGVARVNGTDVDLLAEIVSESPLSTTPPFGARGGEAAFSFTNGVAGQTSVATIRYSFVQKGTAVPISLDGVRLVVGGLVDDPAQRCSIATSDALSYAIENTSNLVASTTTTGLDVAGLAMPNPSLPAAANLISLDFGRCQAFTLRFGCAFKILASPVFRLSGSATNPFVSFSVVPLLSSGGPVRIYYSYDFQNALSVAVPVDFFDRLPTGLFWDSLYTPKIGGNLAANVLFGDGDREASIAGLKLPPGASTLTMATLPVTLTGDILNNASLTFKNGQVIMAANGDTKITIAPPSTVPFTTAFAKSGIAGYGVFITGTSFEFGGSNTTIIPDVGVGPGVLQVATSGIIEGNYYVHPPASGSATGVMTASFPKGVPITPKLRDFTALKAEALALAKQAAALVPTQTFGSISDSTKIEATAPDGLNVILIDNVSLSSRSTLTLKGSASDRFVLNIRNEAQFTSSAALVLAGGLTPNHVLINLLPGALELKTTGKGSVTGAILAVNPGNAVRLGGGSAITVSVIAHEASISGSGTLSPYRYE